MEKGLASFRLSQRRWTDVLVRAVSSLSIATTYMLRRVSIGNFSPMGGVEGICEMQGIEDMGLSKMVMFVGVLPGGRSRSRVRSSEEEKCES